MPLNPAGMLENNKAPFSSLLPSLYLKEKVLNSSFKIKKEMGI